jgi:phenylalanyl-tRNA synthetase alpha subunit
MNDNILDFVLLRIQNELEKYAKSKTIPYDLLEGAYSIDDIKETYYEKLSPKHKKIANKLIKDYTAKINNSIENLKKSLRTEYQSLITGLETERSDFKFPSVLVKYRTNINPIRALYYEIRELTRSYNFDNHYQQWLLNILQDKEFNNKIIDALSIDIKRLEKIVSRYYLPLTKYTNSIPLELFHARQLIKDFRHYKNMFISIQQWDPEE